jgi:hypothetical protein
MAYDRGSLGYRHVHPVEAALHGEGGASEYARNHAIPCGQIVIVSISAEI